MAAIAPVPAEVMAWRYTLSATGEATRKREERGNEREKRVKEKQSEEGQGG
jgi:hypothetical protein